MSNFIKYPRTFHLPWSMGKTSDDKVMQDLSYLEKAGEVVVSLKMDGENTSIYKNGIHARSLDSKNLEYRHWVKALQGRISYMIPENVRICGENMFAKHSIYYTNLSSYFLAFSVWEGEVCWAYDKTKEFLEGLGLQMPEVIYRGKFDKDLIEKAFAPYRKDHEGNVVRVAHDFSYNEFSLMVGKNVRKDHIQTDDHWMHQEIVPNKLRNS